MFVKYDINHRFQHLLGLYEREIYPYLEKAMKKSDVLIDVGANDGYFIMAFLKQGKTVIACEPGNVSAEIVSNARLNNFTPHDNFLIEKRLVGSEKSSEFVSIETLIRNFTGRFFFLVDIDGGEYELLNSCGSKFDFASACWLIETHSNELEKKCVRFLHEKNYKVTIIKNAWWRHIVSEHRPLVHNRWIYAEHV